MVGDIVRLNAGDRVPSDGVIVECSDLTCNESALTGESEDKVITPLHFISHLSSCLAFNFWCLFFIFIIRHVVRATTFLGYKNQYLYIYLLLSHLWTRPLNSYSIVLSLTHPPSPSLFTTVPHPALFLSVVSLDPTLPCFALSNISSYPSLFYPTLPFLTFCCPIPLFDDSGERCGVWGRYVLAIRIKHQHWLLSHARHSCRRPVQVNSVMCRGIMYCTVLYCTVPSLFFLFLFYSDCIVYTLFLPLPYLSPPSHTLDGARQWQNLRLKR